MEAKDNVAFEVLFSRKASKFFRRLPNDLRERARSRFAELAKDPWRFLEHHEGDDFYKFRIGGYRALIDVDLEERLLLVRIFDNRDRIYKRSPSEICNIQIGLGGARDKTS